jgi:hypothetical protein
MKKRKMSLFLLAALLFLFVIASQAGAQPFVLSKVADLNTPIPGGSGNFTSTVYAVISNGNVAFRGEGDSGQEGIYLFNGSVLSKVADLNTPVPGGAGNFIFVNVPVIDDNNVAFLGHGTSGQVGFYVYNGTTLTKAADLNTPIPGGSGNFTGFYHPDIRISSGNVVFRAEGGSGAQFGIYLFNGTTLTKVADLNTPIPDGSGNFTNFTEDPVISGSNVAFIGEGSSGQGIYLFNGTTLTKVADHNTPIPGGSGNFTFFPTTSEISISGSNVAFRGEGDSGQQGIYFSNGTSLGKVADLNTPIPDGSGNFNGFGSPVISGSYIDFIGSGDSGQEIYLFDGTALRKVVDANTPIPGDSGNFTGLIFWAFAGANIAFEGVGASGQRGIYFFHGTTLSKVADINTPIPGGSGNFTGFSDPVIDDGRIAFGAAGTAQEGIYLAIPQARPVDFDGDGKTDIAVYRPSNGWWITVPSSGATPYAVGWGASSDTPVPGDYDGDGKTDISVYRPSNGWWIIVPSSGATPYAVGWGASSDTPMPGDYDGDGKTDIAVYRPSNGWWIIVPSSNPSAPYAVGWGVSSDTPVPGDYDGDGKTGIAVYRPSNGWWIIVPSSGASPYAVGWGVSSDTPVPGDYDGDGKTDIAVYRPSNGWWIIVPSSGASPYAVGWGASGDVPITNNRTSY